MGNNLHKAGMWKRMAAMIFDLILLSVMVVGFGFLLSNALGYDRYGDAVNSAYAHYESEYGVTFDINQETYEAMTEAERANYEAAYNALVSDEDAMYAYNMMLQLTLLITTGGLLCGILLWEFLIPLWLGNGQTVGKKIFNICLVRNDGVKMNTMQLFVRTVLGKFTIETMIPVYILLMLFWGTIDFTGTAIILGLLIGQVMCVLLTYNNTAIHDMLAGTVVVDMTDQTIYLTTEDLIAQQKKVAAERAARQTY